MSEQGKSLGFIETVGLAAAIASADAAVKAANVRLVGRENSKGNGCITVKISGDIGAVNAALMAAKAACESVNRVWAIDAIARPAVGINELFVRGEEVKPEPVKPENTALSVSVTEQSLMLKQPIKADLVSQETAPKQTVTEPVAEPQFATLPSVDTKTAPQASPKKMPAKPVGKPKRSGKR